MLDQLLSWLVIFCPFALSIVPVFIPPRSEDEKSHMKWRYILVGFGILFSIIAWWQQSRAVRASRDDREAAITETSTRVAAETSQRVTKAVSEQYANTISDLNQQIGGLKQELLEQGKSVFAMKGATEKELGLNYVPSVDLLYQNKEFDIFNRGKTNLYLWGDRLDDGPKSVDIPRVVTPTSSYHVYAANIEKEMLDKYGPDSPDRALAFELYVSSEDGKKHIIKFMLLMHIKGGVLTMDTQNIGTVEAKSF